MIIIGDVAAGSSAEKAGILEGDEVIAINKNFSQNLNTYKILLQAPNERVHLIIRRGNDLKELDFKIKSMLSR
jgi:predicted metalloprotease with PDZ domain